MERATETTVLTEVQSKIAAEAFRALMEKARELDPKLDKILRAKYIDDEMAFSKAARELCPSDDPKYWAKSSCNKCYGRGIIGHKVPAPKSKERTPLSCRCIEKAYRRWLVTFRLAFNQQRDEENGNEIREHEEASKASRPQDTQEAHESS